VDWIGVILDNIRQMECPNCGAHLRTSAVRGITAEPSALVVRVACGVCGENSLAIVKRDAPGEAEQPISRDEVLDAHEFLTEWHGTVDEIITPRAA
jgi:formate dehydrogenase assembly factor FdhD